MEDTSICLCFIHFHSRVSEPLVNFIKNCLAFHFWVETGCYSIWLWIYHKQSEWVGQLKKLGVWWWGWVMRIEWPFYVRQLPWHHLKYNNYKWKVSFEELSIEISNHLIWVCCIFQPAFGCCTIQMLVKIVLFGVFCSKKLKNAKKLQIWSKIWQKMDFQFAPKRWSSVLFQKQLFACFKRYIWVFNHLTSVLVQTEKTVFF